MASNPSLLHADNQVQTETLDVLASAENYNRWIFKSFAQFIGPRTLEVGCGTGNFSRLLLERTQHLTAVDIVAPYVEATLSRLTPPDGKTLDVRHQNVLETTDGLGTFDSIVMLNVLEHIENDNQALNTLRGLLKPNGHLIVLVPALDFLYSPYDKSIGHFRRYNEAQLNGVFRKNKFDVAQSQYFNPVGIFGWWLNFCLLKKTKMDAGSVKLFDKLSPLFRTIEEALPGKPPLGLSVITVGKIPG